MQSMFSSHHRVFRIAFVLAAVGAGVACGSNGQPFDDVVPAADAGHPRDGAIADVGSPEPVVDASSADVADAFAWPTCDAKPASAAAKTIPEIWAANPTTETETWVAGAYVTAISGTSCAAGKACQIFLQADPSYASLGAAAKHGIKIFVSAAVAVHFTSVRVGDRVDALGWAWRYDRDAQNELLLEVNAALPGCAKTTSTSNALTPVTGVALSDLTQDLYESTHGPIFVRVAHVSGKPDPSSTTTFGLWPTTDGGFFDGGGADAGASIVSLSPYFLPGNAFTSLTPSVTTRFATITGVFGLFVPSGGPKYLEIYPRAMSDVVLE
jgi:hypothetical protein